MCLPCCGTHGPSQSVDVSGSSLRVHSANVAINGSDVAQVSLHLARADGRGLPGMGARLLAPHCDVITASAVTDSHGDTTGQVRCAMQAEVSVGARVRGELFTAELPATVPVNFYLPADDGRAVRAGRSLAFAYNAPSFTYGGEVRFVSSDPQATLPGPSTLGRADHGSRVWTGLALRTSGPQTITLLDATTDEPLHTESFLVSPAPASTLRLQAPGSAVAGIPFTLHVVALDPIGRSIPSYARTVRFFSQDSAADLPAPTPFTLDDAGERAFSVTLYTAGEQTIIARDPSGTTGMVSVEVAEGPANNLALTVAPLTMAGESQALTVRALDAFGNLATSYRGALHLVADDAAAVLPPDYTLADGDGGTVAWGAGVTWARAGLRTLRVDSLAGDLAAASAAITVVAGPPSRLTFVDLPETASVGETLELTVALEDAFGNAVNANLMPVTLSCSDAAARVPPPFRFALEDSGRHTCASGLTLWTAGPQMLQALGEGVSGAATLRVLP